MRINHKQHLQLVHHPDHLNFNYKYTARIASTLTVSTFECLDSRHGWKIRHYLPDLISAPFFAASRLLVLIHE